ncbi:MAG TPA: hypothetical protein VFZ30_05855, partial [Acidimicrobiales bacterium]
MAAPATPAARLGSAASAPAPGAPTDASTPTSAKNAKPAVPASGRRRATMPNTTPRTAVMASVPTIRASLSLVPKVS